MPDDFLRKEDYISLEDVDERNFARQDPRGFLGRFSNGAVIDEVQRVPDLLSYIQTIVDREQKTGFFILTLAVNSLIFWKAFRNPWPVGRHGVKLMPFTLKEAYGHRIDQISLDLALYTGFIHEFSIKTLTPPRPWGFMSIPMLSATFAC